MTMYTRYLSLADHFWHTFALVNQRGFFANADEGSASANLRNSIAYSPPMTIKQLVELEQYRDTGARSVQRLGGGSSSSSDFARYAQASGRHYHADSGVPSASLHRPSSNLIAPRLGGRDSSQDLPPSSTVMTGACSLFRP